MGTRRCALEDVALSVGGLNADFWRKQRVLLTGHTGFKGAWAALWLESLGATVHGIALAPDHLPDLFSRLAPFARMRSTIADIRDAATVVELVKDAAPTLVLHMAAQPLVRRSYREPVATFASNLMGTVNVLDALRDAAGLAAILVVTTDKVYINNGGGMAFGENCPLGGHDPYSASKACTEIATSAYAQSFFTPAGVSLATARAGNVVGGGDWSPDRIVPDIWRATHAGVPLALRYPDAVRPWQHVLDSLFGYFLYLERLADPASDVPLAMNFGPGGADNMTVADVADVMTAGLRGAQGWVRAEGEHPVEAQTLSLDPTLAWDILSWKTRLPARDALRWTADWYRAFDAGRDIRELCLAQIKDYEALA